MTFVMSDYFPLPWWLTVKKALTLSLILNKHFYVENSMNDQIINLESK